MALRCQHAMRKHVSERLIAHCKASRRFSSRVTVDESELKKFANIASYWWNDVKGPFAALHSMNAVRVPLIRKAIDSIEASIVPTSEDAGRKTSLKDIHVLDVGCGGGILSEALARLGTKVVGVDAADQNIVVARAHAQRDHRLKHNLTYECTTAEALVEQQRQFDCVVSSEVIEHVSDPAAFMEALCALVKPGGALAITTINRTARAFAAAIMGAEYVLQLVEPGTHEWAKFVTPEELQAYAAANGVVAFHQVGMFYNILTHKWSYISDPAVNYGMLFKKPLQ